MKFAMVPHIPPEELVALVGDILHRYEFAHRCPVCNMSIIATLLGQVTFHAVPAEDREDYLQAVIKHTREIYLGMEKHFEHNNVTH
jgi:hypothetical protein